MTWEAVIGLEVHVQLATESKAFSASAARYGATANSLTDPTVLGLPGSLPVFNQRALEYAIALGLATECTIRDRSRFARKHYFYPDLPKGYQISQYDEPLCEHGAIEFSHGDQQKRVRLTRIHLEEDAGKTSHRASDSLVDLNRAGVPLCEVVSEPDIRSGAEAADYMRALRQLVRYLGICEGDMEKGQMRCDANVSIRRAGDQTLGTRAELKNINSFKFVQKAIEHEIARQIGVIESGGAVEQETRLWDADAGLSRSMRSKEEAEDYRYFPDPDLPPLVVMSQAIENIQASLPELPQKRRQRFETELGLSPDDARTLCAERDLADYLEAAVAAAREPASGRRIANWIQSELLRELNRGQIDIADCPVKAEQLAALVDLIESGTISGKIAKTVFAEMYKTGAEAAAIVEARGLKQISDRAQLRAIVEALVAANQSQANEYRAGKHKLLGYFVGKVMKATKGQASPEVVNSVLKELLNDGRNL